MKLSQSKPRTKLTYLYIVWSVVLAVPWIIVVSVVKPYWHANDIIHLLLVGLGVNIVSVLLFGYYLGSRQHIKDVLVASFIGTGVLAVCYDLLMVTQNPNDPNSDIEAGAGLAMFFLPTVVAIGILLLTGFGIARVLTVKTNRNP